MDAQPTSSKRPIADVYETDALGGVGEAYSRLIATGLLTRATLANRPFKLGIEVKNAAKFDDVAFFNDSTQEWWLIQAKHSLDAKVLTWESLLPKKTTDDGFRIDKYFKSYQHLKQNWRFGGKELRLYLFTNRPLDSNINTQPATVDEMLKFSEGNHVQLQLEYTQIVTNYLNYNEISDSVVKFFNNGKDINNLRKYSKLMSQVLVKDGLRIKFRDTFLRNNSNPTFYDMLKTAFANKELPQLSVKAPAQFPDFWSKSYRHNDPPPLDNETVKAFLNTLVLSVSQPNVEKLREDIQSDWTRWTKSWIRPDVYQQLTSDQLNEPFNTFQKRFEEWEKPFKKPSCRQFMTHAMSGECLVDVKNKLLRYVKQYGRQVYVGLDASEKYYVKRWITFENWRMTFRDKTRRLSDEEFVDWLYENWTDQECIALFAEPGMGKSTLWQHLAFRMQQKNADVVAFLIYLNDLNSSKLETINRNTSVERAVNILNAVVSDENVQILLDKTQKVFIFMDAFDELKEEYKQLILNFITILKTSGHHIKFLLSSRERCRSELEANLHLKVIDVLGFDKSDRRELLRLFWKPKNTSKFDAYSKELIGRFERDTPRADIDFIGLPLTMKMLAEVFQEPFVKFLKNADITEPGSFLSEQSIDIIFLYKQFTDKCIKLTLNKKWKLDIDVERFPQCFEPQISSASKNYQLLAMEKMIIFQKSPPAVLLPNHHLGECDKALWIFLLKQRFGEIEIDQIFDAAQQADLEKFRESICEGLEESLLLETINGTPRFVHQSYAEYLSAMFLFDHMSSSGMAAKVGKILVFAYPWFEHVRKFFLKILDSKLGSIQSESSHEIYDFVDMLKNEMNKLEAWACEDNCANLLSRILNTAKLSVTDSGVTLLHIAAKSNACEAMEVLLKVCTNVDVEDCYKRTPLSTACINNNLEMVKLLVDSGAKLPNKAIQICVEKFPSTSRTIETIQYLIKVTASVNPEYSENINNALYYASDCKEENISLVQGLIEQGATADYSDSHQRTALHKAVEAGKTTIVEELIKCGANINAQDVDGNTPLHLITGNYRTIADRSQLWKHLPYRHLQDDYNKALQFKSAEQIQLDTVKELIAKKADIHLTNNDQQTILHIAAHEGREAIVGELLNSGANVNAQDKNDDTPIHLAAKSFGSIVKELKRERDYHKFDPNEETNLFITAEQIQLNIVKALIATTANINLTNNNQKTTLHIATRTGRTAVVEELLNSGANINAQDKDSDTPIHLAAKCFGSIIRQLNVRNWDTTISFLFTTAERMQLNTVKVLISREAQINITNKYKKTPLHIAAYYSRTAVVEELLNGGANIKAQDENGDSPIHFAAKGFGSIIEQLIYVENWYWNLSTTAEQMQLNTVKVLIAREAQINLTNNYQQTTLHIAAHEGRKAVVEELLNSGAHINAQDQDGNTPIHSAAMSFDSIVGQLKRVINWDTSNSDDDYDDVQRRLLFTVEQMQLNTVKVLISKRADINLTNKHQETVLHIAALRGRTAIVKELLKCNIDITAKDKDGRTPLDCATAEDHVDIVKLLHDYGSTIE